MQYIDDCGFYPTQYITQSRPVLDKFWTIQILDRNLPSLLGFSWRCDVKRPTHHVSILSSLEKEKHFFLNMFICKKGLCELLKYNSQQQGKQAYDRNPIAIQ